MAKSSTELKMNYFVLVVVRIFTYLFISIVFRPRVIGKQHIPKKGAMILVPTHRSRWDPLVIQMSTIRKLRPMASVDEFVGLQGWFMHKLGAFPVDTRKPSPAVVKLSREMLREGQCVVIFAEGTIFFYTPNQVHPIKSGPAWIALASLKEGVLDDIPIVPVRLNYPRQPVRLFDRIEIVIQPPISVTEFAEMPREQGIEALTEKIQASMGDEVNWSLAEMIVPRSPMVKGQVRGLDE